MLVADKSTEYIYISYDCLERELCYITDVSKSLNYYFFYFGVRAFIFAKFYSGNGGEFNHRKCGGVIRGRGVYARMGAGGARYTPSTLFPKLKLAPLDK